MKKEMLINVMQSEECRIAILEDGVLEELYVERTSQESYVGNIYKGRIVNIEPSIQAVFVDFGIGRNGFLHVSDVDPVYYRHLDGGRGEREERGGGRGGRDDRGGRGRNDRGRGRGGRDDRGPRRPRQSMSYTEEELAALESGDPMFVEPEAVYTPAADEYLPPELADPEPPLLDEAPAPIPPPVPVLVARRQPDPVVVSEPVAAGGFADDLFAEPEPAPNPVVAVKPVPVAPPPIVAEPEIVGFGAGLEAFEETPPPPAVFITAPDVPAVPAMPPLVAALPVTEPVAEPEKPVKKKPKSPKDVAKTKAKDKAKVKAKGKKAVEDEKPAKPVRKKKPAPEAEVVEPPAPVEDEKPAKLTKTRRARKKDDDEPPKVMGATERRTTGDDDELYRGFNDPALDAELEPIEPELLDDEYTPPDFAVDVDGDGDDEPAFQRADEFEDGPPPRRNDRGRNDRGRGPRSNDRDRDRGRGGRPGLNRPRPLIQDIFKRGQEVIVQVIKEGMGTKGPTLSTYISIAGRYLVLMPGLNRIGVSRKIADDNARARLREILTDLRPPKGLGFIIRTAGVDRNKKELQNDLAYLLRLWQIVVKRLKKLRAPIEIYRESDMITRTIRDTFTADIDSIVIDEPEAFTAAQEFLQVIMPRYADRIHLADGTAPLFHQFKIEDEIARIQNKYVPLPNGGSIVIEQTEALVAIDVNSGNFRADNNAEETAYQMNLLAAKEIARQLRLRDLGGVIVNDFIDMKSESHRRNVENAMRQAVGRDRARTKVLKISPFGLIEMTRQRIRPSLKRNTYSECSHCRGTGYVKTSESMSIEVMRLIQLAAHRRDIAKLQVRVHADVAAYLLNRKRKDIAKLEDQSQLQVAISGLVGVSPESVEFLCHDATGHEVKFVSNEPPPRLGGHKPQPVLIQRPRRDDDEVPSYG
jgi:ribonuclease E